MIVRAGSELGDSPVAQWHSLFAAVPFEKLELVARGALNSPHYCNEQSSAVIAASVPRNDVAESPSLW
jgi:hypothetical protein